MSTKTPKSAGAPPPPVASKKNGRPSSSYAGAAQKGAPIPTPSVIKFDDDVDYKRAEKLKQKGRASSQRQGGFFSWIFNLFFKAGVIYLLVGAFWSCGSKPFTFDYNPKDDRAHCRTLAHAKANLQPVVTPYIDAAQAKIDPYTKPYVDAATPYVNAVYKTARPYYRYASKKGHKYYKKNVDPLRKQAIQRARSYSDPHIKTATAHYNKQVQPHVDNFHKAVKPYKDIYRRDVSPYLDQAYLQSLAFGSASYGLYVSRVHPLVVRSLNEVHSFYINHFDPAVRRTYALYIRPQVNKALEKVFGHRAHALGSDALKDARQDIKKASEEGKAQKKEKVAEAKASASRAVEDPTLADRVNIAKDHVTGGPLAAKDPVASAASDAELQVEESTVKQQLEAWEKGLAHLIDEEYKLALERITQIRSRFSDSLPDRFGIMTEDVETEVEGIFARLLKTFGKLKSSERPLDERVQTGNDAIDKQRAKLERSRSKTVANLNGLHEELQQEERTAQKASVEEVSRYISEAQKSYKTIIGQTKFPQTRSEWEGWDSGLSVRSSLFNEELDEVRSGSRQVARGVVGIDPGHEGDVQRQIAKLIKQIETLYDTALAELASFSSKELSELGGTAAAAAAGAILESVAGNAQKLTEEAREVLQDAAGALSGSAGSGAAAALSSKASEASSSASSLAREAAKTAGIKVSPQSPGEYVEDFTSRAGDVAQQASSAVNDAGASASSIARQGAKSAGFKVNPETPGEYVEDFTSRVGEAAGQASSAVNDAAASASSIARQGAKSAGLKVNPETPGEYIEDLTSRVGDAASQVSSVVGDAAASGSSIARQGAKSAGLKVNPETPGEYLEDFTSRAGNVAQHVASEASEIADAAQTGLSENAAKVSSSASSLAREAAKTAGLKVQPESPSEYAEAAAGVVADGAALAAEEAYKAVHGATRSVASAAGAKVTPETPDEYIESIVPDGVYNAASSLSSAGEAASSAVADAMNGDAVHKATRSVASAAGVRQTPESASEYLEAAQIAVSSGLEGGKDALASGSMYVSSAVDDAGDALHRGTRSAASAVGVSRSPESLSEYAEAAGSVLSQATDAAGSVVGQASDAAESVLSDAGDAIHQATRSAASVAGYEPSAESAGDVFEKVKSAVGAEKKPIKDEL